MASTAAYNNEPVALPVGAQARFPAALFGGQLTPTLLFDAAFNRQACYNFLANLHNDPAIYGIEIEDSGSVRELIRKFFFFNIPSTDILANDGNIPPTPGGVLGAPPTFPVTDPMWIRFLQAGTAPPIPNPVYVTLRGVQADKSHMPIVDYGSALGFIFSVALASFVITDANKNENNYALPTIYMYATFLAKVTRASGDVSLYQTWRYPTMVCGMYVNRAPGASPARAGKLLMGATLVRGAGNPALAPDPATGINAKDLGRIYRRSLLNDVRELPLGAPCAEWVWYNRLRNLLRGNYEFQAHDFDRTAYQLTDATVAPNVVRNANYYNFPAAWRQANWKSPYIRFNNGEFNNDIWAFARRYRREIDGIALPVSQPGAPALPYFGGGSWAADSNDFIRRIFSGKRPQIVPTGTRQDAAQVTVAGVTYDWVWENVYLPPNPGFNPPNGRITNLLAFPTLSGAGRMGTVVPMSGKLHGHCAETYPYIYWHRIFRQNNILHPTNEITDAQPLNPTRILESWSLYMPTVHRDVNAIGNNFLRSRIKATIPFTQRLRLLRDPCDNCKGLARAHKHDDENFATFCATLQALYLANGAGRMTYPPQLAANRTVW